MKNKILFLSVIVVLLGLGLFGYFRATSNYGEPGPKIEIDISSFDFGEIEYGQVAEHVFKITNSGEGVLEIKRVSTSCACTTGKVGSEKISPGEETDLTVSYNTGAMSGPHAFGDQERIIFIQTNDPISPQIEVTIHARVK